MLKHVIYTGLTIVFGSSSECAMLMFILIFVYVCVNSNIILFLFNCCFVVFVGV